MKAKSFQRVSSLEEAYKLVKESPRNKIVAGGLWLKKGNADVDVLIDDYSRNLEGPKRYNSICYDYPWNQDFVDDQLRNFRIHNWNEIYDVINNISGGKYTYKGEI